MYSMISEFRLTVAKSIAILMYPRILLIPIQFISFIVEVEKVLGIELPDEFLLLPNYSSFNALCCALMNISEKAKENLCEKGGENT